MTKQVRDWQEDKNELDLFMDGWFPGGASNTRDAVLAFFYFAKEALPYYHQQYAAEKERADKLEERNKALIAAVTADANGTFRCVEEARAEAAETREKKLRKAIEEALSWTWDCAEGNMLEVRDILTASLYPEEETK